MRNVNFRMFKFSHAEGAFEKYENLHHSKISRYTVLGNDGFFIIIYKQQTAWYRALRLSLALENTHKSFMDSQTAGYDTALSRHDYAIMFGG